MKLAGSSWGANARLPRLHEADEAAVDWLTTYGS